MLKWIRRTQGNGWVYYCDNPVYHEVPVPFLYKIMRRAPLQHVGFQAYVMGKSDVNYDTGETKHQWVQLGHGSYSLKAAKENCEADFKRRNWTPVTPAIDELPF
tara:strand:- start:220 stop:531 length:312 start_codon:yes stop_codon:yes gene_type:complete